jgi:hypothetical protein
VRPLEAWAYRVSTEARARNRRALVILLARLVAVAALVGLVVWRLA